MNRYIDAEKLKAEIRRRIDEEKHKVVEGTGAFYGARQQVYSSLLSFIESLEKEHPIDGLDKAAKEYAENEAYGMNDDLIWICNDTFKAGAKWMAEQGELYEGKIQVSMRTGDLVAVATVPDEKYNFNDKVVVQIRKAE